MSVTVREPAPSEKRSVVIREQNAPAPGAGVGYWTVPVAHEDAVPLQLLANILATGKSSRIYRKLVADNHPANRQSMGSRYGIRGIPAFYLLGRDGKVAAVDCRGPRLAQEVGRLIGAGG